ncbi:LmbU family transcriptional regulator [Amycolatopsis sp. GM8]|uniref:LmbU family transcriptional regulator n=1 Tax=Amycolatopsis sp. GM8 TaxID=2896530 RepID=UPI001F28B45D|nr:LmbU family transcriptional regulator [Amycolatopsis sp. GM8]
MGLQLPDRLEYENWEEAGQKLARIADSSSWCLGDWMIYGEKAYVDRYRFAINAIGLDYQTLRNYAWVCRRFAPDRRRGTLSFQHHAEVASLGTAEQDHWLDESEKQRWSRNKLRENLRAHRKKPGAAAPQPAAIPQLSVAQERIERWQSAAEQSGRSLEQWITASLDHVAQQVLGDVGRSA